MYHSHLYYLQRQSLMRVIFFLMSAYSWEVNMTSCRGVHTIIQEDQVIQATHLIEIFQKYFNHILLNM